MLDKVLLFPYYTVLKIRNHKYDTKPSASTAASVPTICVGNVTVGGTGKTPHTEMILRLLREDAFWGKKSLAVLSLGYKRRSKGYQEVPEGGSGVEYGDEPVQIKGKFPDVKVAVCKDRVEGCKRLCPPCDLVVLDDAYQYRRLKPTASVVLMDWSRPVFSDSLLPMGTLRDLPKRIYDADILIVSKSPRELTAEEKAAFLKNSGYSAYDAEECVAVTPSGKPQSVYFSYIDYAQMQPVFEEADPHFIYSRTAVLFTGIAQDGPLHDYLSDTYKVARKFSFPDHHQYGSSDMDAIYKAIRENPTAVVVTTEKDAQRLACVKNFRPELKSRLFYVPICAAFETQAEKVFFKEKLLSLIKPD